MRRSGKRRSPKRRCSPKRSPRRSQRKCSGIWTKISRKIKKGSPKKFHRSKSPKTPNVFSPFGTVDKWEIFSLKGCGACEQAKELLKKKNITFSVKDSKDDKDYIESKMGNMKYPYWPKIFKNDVFFGGLPELINNLK